jgi:hypothetical protein
MITRRIALMSFASLRAARSTARRLLAVLLTVVTAGCGAGTTGAPVADKAGVPTPRPVSTDGYQVGAYYFPGWPTRAKWEVLDNFPERRPLLGYYAEGDPVVMDWQIKWAVEHGITFFAFDWYWDRGRRQLEHALHEGYLKARFRPLLKFCLLWANHNPPGSSTEADLMALVDFWIAQYFGLPEYLTVDDKPVVIVYAPSLLRNDMGSEAVAAAIRQMRARVETAGYPGLFLMGTVDDDHDEQARLAAEGYDAGTGYNYHRAGMPDKSATASPYDSAVDDYERIWLENAKAGFLDYVPVTEPGWDSRPWDGDKALVRTGRTPEKFADMLTRARTFVDRHPVAGGKRIVLIEAWNEYGEGAVIEPHREWGFAYLDVVRRVFASEHRPHRDVIPEDLGRSVPLAP